MIIATLFSDEIRSPHSFRRLLFLYVLISNSPYSLMENNNNNKERSKSLLMSIVFVLGLYSIVPLLYMSKLVLFLPLNLRIQVVCCKFTKKKLRFLQCQRCKSYSYKSLCGETVHLCRSPNSTVSLCCFWLRVDPSCNCSISM